MPDETATTATESGQQPATTATQTQHAGTGPGAQEDKEPERLPELYVGVDNEKWVKFLQQTLNYHYQMQVVPESGEFDGNTANAVSHYRQQNRLDAGEHVDIPMWEKLGVENTHKAWEQRQAQRTAQQEQHQQQGGAHGTAGHETAGHQASHGEPINVEHPHSPVDLRYDQASWAAAMAMVLNPRGNDFTVDSLCERAGVNGQDMRSAQEAVSIGTSLGLQEMPCYGGTVDGWAEALRHGLLWTPNPVDNSKVIVVSGAYRDDHQVSIKVIDPSTGHDGWMPFADFTQQYGINDSYQGQLLYAG